MIPTTTTNTLLLACLTLTAAGIKSSAFADDLPEGVVNTQDPTHHSLTPEESLARITVPEGFHVFLFAGEPDIRRPIAFDFDDRGRLWVVENYSHPHLKDDGHSDRVVILEDTNNDGQFDNRTVFWDEGRYLTGIAVGYHGVWLANTPELVFIPDRNRDDIPDAPPQPVLNGFQKSTNNVINNLHWGPDGWLYGAIGLASRSLVGDPHYELNDTQHRVPITRGIWRYHPVRKEFEKVAEGMVNPWGADFNEFGDLITSNTVIAHLWHIVPGMYCERRASERDNPFAYERIQTIANHLHWGGGAWNESRNPSSQKGGRSPDKSAVQQREHDYHQHSVAGGGHAHCGAMIYLGDNWPEEYRGTFFTNNLHGNRINNDILKPNGSSWVAGHADDFLFGNDPWFRGMSVKYGPDGGVFVSDWHDFGECHDSDGSHRTSGRIYKVVFGKPRSQPVDLQALPDDDLVDLHQHSNEWMVRHARRILHERSLANESTIPVSGLLWELFKSSAEIQTKLKTLWTLHTVGKLTEEDCRQLCQHENEHVRRWAVRFLVDHLASDMSAPVARQKRRTPAGIAEHLATIAAGESSPKVRMELACALQRLDVNDRLPLAEGLLGHNDSTDPYIPLMIWYGLEPAVAAHPEAALTIAAKAKIPLVRRFIARRIADQKDADLNLIITAAAEMASEARQRDLLTGLLESLDGKGSHAAPADWAALYARVDTSEDSELRAVALKLATIFGDANAIASLRSRMLDTAADNHSRLEAFTALARLSDGIPVAQLHQIVANDETLRTAALQELVVRSDTSTAAFLLQQLSKFNVEERQQAVAVLVSTAASAVKLLEAIKSGQADRNDVSAFALQHLRSYSTNDVQQNVAAIWADAATLKKSEELHRLTDLMTQEHLALGNASAGRLVFRKMCSKCHTLFGEGGNIAPDLTGSGRRKPDYVLRNLIDPNEEVDAAYRLTTVLTTNGRLLSGFVVKQDDTWIEIRTQDTRARLKMKDVEELRTSHTSMMPEGMLQTLTDDQIRDLLVYLASEEQVVLP